MPDDRSLSPSHSSNIVSTPALPARSFAEGLPFALVSALERRYLTHFDASQWTLSGPSDEAQPLLQQVLALGRPRQSGEWARAMPHVLTACHEPGHSLVMVLHGTGAEHRMYLGGRRVVGAAARSTNDFLQAQAGAFKAYFTGLELAPPRALHGTEMPELSRLLSTGQAVGTVTGIPSGRGGRMALDMQSLDRVVRAVGSQRFALMVIAEPQDHDVIDITLDACRRLRTEIHAFIRRTQCHSQGGSESQSRSSEQHGRDGWAKDLPEVLFGISVFLQVLGIGAMPFRAASQAVQSVALFANMRMAKSTKGSSQQVSETNTWSDGDSIEFLDANAEACDRLLQRHIDRLQAARSGGWWQTAVYIVGENDAALYNVASALRSTCAGDATELDPLRLIELPPHLLRPAIQRGQVLSMRTATGSLDHPLGESFSRLGTCLNADELAVLINLPQQEIPGVPMRDRSEFALCAPAVEDEVIELGWVRDSTGRDLSPVTITSAAMNRHVLVTGITGSGKTNTCMHLLLQTYEKLSVPFLVIEPAKTEYSKLAQVESLRSQLRVYGIGGNAPLPLRLNPLAPVPGISLARHIDLLKAVFNASFPMFAGMTYVLEEAIHETYTERGWNLYDSTNPYLSPQATSDERAALTPSLQDLHDKIETVLKSKQYSQEIHQNLGAALRSRLRSLLVGNKGLVLNARHGVPLDDLFARPAVIELQELGDDEEKSFVMALLFVLLYEYAESRQSSVPESRRERLQHVTLIEEAHRLLQGGTGPQSPEVGNPRAKAVAMFTDMLAEMRALGEGFVVAEQIPTKLASEILKNSGLKIAHRLVAPDDRLAVGSCLNLTDRQSRDLNNLSCGLAVMHDERVGEALLVRVAPVKGVRVLSTSQGPTSANLDRRYLRRDAGCHHCPLPCDFLHRLPRTDMSRDLAPFFESLLLGTAEAAWGHWARWSQRREWQSSSGNGMRGVQYCAATRAASIWFGRVVAARHSALDSGEQLPQALLEVERVLREMSLVVRSWSEFDTLDQLPREVFADVQRRLQAILLTNPVLEQAGCQACPCRCRMLPFVSPHLTRLAQPIEAALLSQQPFDRRLKILLDSLRPTIKTLPGELVSQNDESHWGYCAVANHSTTAATEDQRQQFLEGLLSSV
ncbi:MAG: ATP-binding protein [Planctomycetaceae bacterium]